jgi:predicted nucleotidyltransferase
VKSEAQAMMDPVLEFLAREARGLRSVEKVLLFGSRARGDAQDRSDYDIAVLAPAMSHADWAAWTDKLTATAPTLLALDLVLLTADLSPKLRENITREGRVVYVKD